MSISSYRSHLSAVLVAAGDEIGACKEEVVLQVVDITACWVGREWTGLVAAMVEEGITSLTEAESEPELVAAVEEGKV